jgi:pentatricopeptide repeat protein
MAGKQVHQLVSSGQIETATKLYFTAPDAMGASTLIPKCINTIEAQKIYHALKKPNNFVFCAMMGICAKFKQPELAQMIYSDAKKHNIMLDTKFMNLLLKVFTTCNKMDIALHLLDEMMQHGPKPDSYSFSILLSGCTEDAHRSATETVYSVLVTTGIPQNIFIKNSVIKAFVATSQLDKAIVIFDEMVRSGPTPDKYTISTLLSGCTESRLVDGERIISSINKLQIKLDDVTIRDMIIFYASCGKLKAAMDIIEDQICKGTVIDAKVFTILLNACADVRNFKLGYRLHEITDTYHNLIHKNNVIKMYCKWEMLDRAINVFNDMLIHGPEPDKYTYSSLLASCADIASEALGTYIHRVYLQRSKSSLEVDNTLIDMYAKCGEIEQAEQVFASMNEKDIVTYNALIFGYGMNRCVEKALDLLDIMQNKGIIVDAQTLAGALSACNHGIKVDQAVHIFRNMKSRYNITPNKYHYACMIDTYARAGILEKAENILEECPHPDSTMFTALLSGCRKFNDSERAKRISQKLITNDPMEASTYMLMKNVYAKQNMWKESRESTKMMSKYSVNRIPGKSSIYIRSCEADHDYGSEYNDKVHSFVVEDDSHPLVKKILEELDRQRSILERQGYIADTTCVMKELKDDEAKKEHLWRHSEKLALGLGLILGAAGTPLTITKNLRFCSDCHEVARLVSKYENRAIKIRDASSWHKFKHGVCSCGENY